MEFQAIRASLLCRLVVKWLKGQGRNCFKLVHLFETVYIRKKQNREKKDTTGYMNTGLSIVKVHRCLRHGVSRVFHEPEGCAARTPPTLNIIMERG